MKAGETSPEGGTETLPIDPQYESQPDGFALKDPARPDGLWVKRGKTLIWTPGAVAVQPAAEAPIPPPQ
jgi:hypothetical protein